MLILAATILGALVTRMIYPEMLPILDTLAIIFYLIIAVTVIAVLRNFVGLTTYGVFGPAVISISLSRIGSLGWGLVAVFAVLGVGILMRFALEPLKLQMTHRLALVVTAVAFAFGAIVLVGARIGNVTFSYVEFLPIIITSWIAERFVRDRLESTCAICLQRLAYTIVAVLVSYVLISYEAVVRLFIYTPEMWILPIAINILIGSSVRVRLMERLRFKTLSGVNRGGRKYAGILTMNVRNRDFIERYNPRETHLDVTKLSVKGMLRGAGVPVPMTLATFDALEDLGNLQGTLSEIPEGEGFVAKPNDSFGGRGILVVKRRMGDVLEKADGTHISLDDLRRHIEGAIDGEYSGRWLPDKAFLEELVVPHPDMARLSHSGLPDVRIIVFRGVPVMAMTRLPTRISGGKANLTRGALGGGICLTSGRIENVVLAHGGETVKTHPDTGIELIGQQIPFWGAILEMAVKAQRATGIGYAGVDIAVDAVRGPVVMEVNKRPGLEIQNATNRPLLARLRTVEATLDGRQNVTVREGIEMMHSLEASGWQPVVMKMWAGGGVAE